MRHTHGTARFVCRFVFMEAWWSHNAIFWQFYINNMYHWWCFTFSSILGKQFSKNDCDFFLSDILILLSLVWQEQTSASLVFLSAVSTLHPHWFRFELCLHDRCVLLGCSVRMPSRQQHYSHRHPGVPTGIQVEEAPCGQEDAGWVRHVCFCIVTSSVCWGRAGVAFFTVCNGIHVRISAGVCLHSQSRGPRTTVLRQCLIKLWQDLICSNPVEDNKQD